MIKNNRTPFGNESSIQEIKFSDEVVKVHYTKLEKAGLDYAVALATGAKPNILDCKKGGDWIGYDIVDNPIQPFWRCVKGFREGYGKIPVKSHHYQPTQDSCLIIDLIQEFRIKVESHDYHFAKCTISKHGVDYVIDDESIYDSVCRVVVLATLGDWVEIPVDLLKEIELSYKIVL